ncbi:hypothetical protein [Methylobacterium sp. ID0610]|uniref:hypothetical protein n=1 Tax=Methylobacterium carpenticola TaxID=3344827 RepID=UPI0036761292
MLAPHPRLHAFSIGVSGPGLAKGGSRRALGGWSGIESEMPAVGMPEWLKKSAPAVACLLGGAAAGAELVREAAPVNNWAEMRAALAGCWHPPPDTEGWLIAFRFGLDKTGSLRGKPLVTARRLAGDRDAAKHFEDAAFDALSRCFPMRVTPAFGAILGESPIRLRFANTPATAAYQINSNITIFAPQKTGATAEPPLR